jgi:hypothetical protein
MNGNLGGECPVDPRLREPGQNPAGGLKNIRKPYGLSAERGLPLPSKPPTGRSHCLMSALPVLSGRKVGGCLKKSAGKWIATRQPYHQIKDGEIATLSIPDHKEVAKERFV